MRLCLCHVPTCGAESPSGSQDMHRVGWSDQGSVVPGTVGKSSTDTTHVVNAHCLSLLRGLVPSMAALC